MIENGVTINGLHTYKDFGLILEECVISPPDPKLFTINVPGRNGLLDVTKAISEVAVYENRTITLEFRLKRNTNADFLATYSRVQNLLHGKESVIVLDDDKGYYYTGRVMVDSFNSSKYLGKITLICDVEPFKLAFNQPGDDWLWDPFSFINGVIYPGTYSIKGSKEIMLPCEGLETRPKFIVETSEDMNLLYNNTEYTLYGNATTIIKSFILKPGETKVVISGTGKVKISYTGGSL